MAELTKSEGQDAERRFDDVYEKEFAFVWRSVGRLGVPESLVDDVVQDVFVVVHRKLHEFEMRSSMKTWLFAIVRRTVRDYRRTSFRKPANGAGPLTDHDVDNAPTDGAPGPHEAVVKKEAVRTLYALLAELDLDKREVFILAELEQMTGAEIAEALGVNVNTVYARLRAARAAFDAALTRLQAREARQERGPAQASCPEGAVRLRRVEVR
jgi:RNA polymerase sigma-70 factor (ECF subfamily)